MLAQTGAHARERLTHALRTVCPQPVLNWREAQYYGRYGEVELHFLDILCAPTRDSIDVGAHDGCYVHFLRRHSRHVHAFEPIPWMAEALIHKFHHGVTVHPIALSHAAGTATLHMPLDDGSLVPGCATISDQASSTYAGCRDIAVPTEPLDDVYAGEAGFVKIDVEGHEEDVLAGGWRTIERDRPAVLIEVMERLSPGGTKRVSAFFAALGYRGAFVRGRRLLPVEAFDPASMQRDQDYPDLHASLPARDRFGPYVYNFIFVPRGDADRVFRRIERRLGQL